MNLRDVKLRARALFRPQRVEQELHEELAFHIARETKRLIDEGLAPALARRRAQARFGSPTLTADECRDERGTAFIDNTIADIRYALRTFRRAPLAAFTIVVTVAIGLGVVAMLFTFLNTFLFRVDRVPAINEMYAVERPRPANGERSLLTRPRFEALRTETNVFTDAYAALPDIDVRVDGRMMAVTLVTGNFFQVVRVDAVIGRALGPADDARSGGHPVIVLSDRGWDRRFNRDPNVLGRTVLVAGSPFEIVGVMPAGFRGLAVGAPDFWAPLSQLAQFRPGQRGREDSVGVEIVGRLKPGLSMENARAQVAAWDSNQSAAPVDRRAMNIELLPRRGTIPQPMEAVAIFTPLFFAFGLILMIDPNMGPIVTMRTLARLETFLLGLAFWVSLILGGLALVLTVAGLFSVLSYLVAQRTREIGVRLALGASPRQVTQLILSQTTRPVSYGLLAGAGLAATLATALIATQAGAIISEIVHVTDPVAYAASLIVIITACLVAAWIPAMRAARVDPMETLRRE